MRAHLSQGDAGVHHPEPGRVAGGALKVALAHPFEKGRLLPFDTVRAGALAGPRQALRHRHVEQQGAVRGQPLKHQALQRGDALPVEAPAGPGRPRGRP